MFLKKLIHTTARTNADLCTFEVIIRREREGYNTYNGKKGKMWRAESNEFIIQ